jgi:hypothetical protein
MILCSGDRKADLKKRPPAFSETFSMQTTEFDTTLNNTIVVEQLLLRDPVAQRSFMAANGSLVQGGLEEVMRCDLHPGYAATAGGPDPADRAHWQCRNQTISGCQWSPFWPQLPENTTYVGQEKLDGRICDRWEYWENNELFGLWAAATSSVPMPVSLAKLFTKNTGYHLWQIFFRNFKAAAPAASAFVLSSAIPCSPTGTHGAQADGSARTSGNLWRNGAYLPWQKPTQEV